MSSQGATHRRATMTPNSERTSSEAAAARMRALIHHLMSGPQEAWSTVLARLERAVCAYEIDFRAFLNGQRHRPPFELGTVLEAAFRQIAAAAERGAVPRLAAETLEARFQAGRRLLMHRLERADRTHPRNVTAA